MQVGIIAFFIHLEVLPMLLCELSVNDCMRHAVTQPMVRGQLCLIAHEL